MANGVPDMRAESYFAGGFAALDKALDESLRKRKMAASKLTPGEMKIDAITLAPVDAAQGDLIDDELKIMYEPRKGDLPSLVRSIRATAAKYPQSAYALALLAEAEWKAEQKDAALADADRSIALDPKSARAYAVRAQVLLERAHESDKAEDWKAALTAIVRANKADTEDPVPLALFYRYHAMRGGKMPDIGYEGLYKAYTLLPQNPDYRFNFAEAMAARGNYAWASTLLDPIAYSPHGSEMREAALRMKADFDAQAAKKKPAGTPPPGS
jgi:tetratricopeptide (TPR) repeat protein